MTSPEKLVRPEILALKAYHVPPSKGMVKLDAMENPYPLPDALRKELATVLSRVDLNRYPEPTSQRLVELITAKRMDELLNELRHTYRMGAEAKLQRLTAG